MKASIYRPGIIVELNGRQDIMATKIKTSIILEQKRIAMIPSKHTNTDNIIWHDIMNEI